MHNIPIRCIISVTLTLGKTKKLPPSYQISRNVLMLTLTFTLTLTLNLTLHSTDPNPSTDPNCIPTDPNRNPSNAITSPIWLRGWYDTIRYEMLF